MKLNLDYSLYHGEGLDRDKVDAMVESTFQEVKLGKPVYSEDNFLVIHEGDTVCLGNLSYSKSGESSDNAHIWGVLSYVDPATGEDFMFNFSFPVQSVSSFKDLLGKLETIK